MVEVAMDEIAMGLLTTGLEGDKPVAPAARPNHLETPTHPSLEYRPWN
jgi:hypothetical protein